jgi:hypothetical protein
MDSSHNGPDELAPAESYVTWHGDKAVRLRTGKTGPESEKPISVVTAFKETVKKSPNHPALSGARALSWRRHNGVQLS